MHKHSNLQKVHIWGTTDGLPIYIFPTHADGQHDDGSIMSACFNKQFVLKCLKEIEEHGENSPNIKGSFKTKKICKELLYLQKLFNNYGDNFISDNGYIRSYTDSRIHAPLQQPKVWDDDGRTSVLAANRKRSLTFTRQTQERLNRRFKANAMLRKKLHINDVHRIPMIWKIIAADIIYRDDPLMTDSEDNTNLANRLVDMKLVANNPADYWLFNKSADDNEDIIEDDNEQKTTTKEKDTNQKRTEKKKKRKRQQNKKTTKEKQQPKKKNNKRKKPKKFVNLNEWELCASGWENIAKYLLKQKKLQKELNLNEPDIVNFIGKKYQNSLCRGYLSRMSWNNDTFQLYVNKENCYVFLIKNMKSKWKSSNQYDIVVSFEQVILYNKSLKQFQIEKEYNDLSKHEWIELVKQKTGKSQLTRSQKRTIQTLKNVLYRFLDIYIDNDDRHWIKWLRQDICNSYSEKKPVSYYLSDKYIERNTFLTKKRKERIKRRHKLQSWYGNVQLDTMTIKELKEFADEKEIKYSNKLKKQKLIEHILNSFDNDDDNNNRNDDDNNNHNNVDLSQSGPTPESQKYLLKYPKEKSWYDLNFNLFKTSLAKIQISCTCCSGAQLPGSCAHGSSSIFLFNYGFEGRINDIVKQTLRDKKIQENIYDLTPYKDWCKQTDFNSTLCVCHKVTVDKTMVLCDGCRKWWHPLCLNTTMEEVRRDKDTFNIWHCSYCKSYDVWIVRNVEHDIPDS